MMVGDASSKHVIFILAFLIAGSLQENESSRNLSKAARQPFSNDEARRNEFNNDSSSMKTAQLLNSSVILDTSNATNSTQLRGEQGSSSNLELLHILKERLTFYFAEKQSFASSLLIILLAATSIATYLVLVSWRRHLQRIYGNRECLVQNEVLNEKNSPYL